MTKRRQLHGMRSGFEHVTGGRCCLPKEQALPVLAIPELGDFRTFRHSRVFSATSIPHTRDRARGLVRRFGRMRCRVSCPNELGHFGPRPRCAVRGQNYVSPHARAAAPPGRLHRRRGGTAPLSVSSASLTCDPIGHIPAPRAARPSLPPPRRAAAPHPAAVPRRPRRSSPPPAR